MIPSCCGTVFVILLITHNTQADNETFSNGCHNQSDLVNMLCAQGHLKDKILRQLMKMVDRENYILNGSPYVDVPVKLPSGVVDIPPRMHAFILETINNHMDEGFTVLEVGFGSGYLSMCLAIVVTHFGKVVGVEENQAQVEYARNAFRRDLPNECDEMRVAFFSGNVLEIAKREGPFDIILVYPAVDPESNVAETLLAEITKGGRMIIPLGKPGRMDSMTIYDRDLNGTLNITKVSGDFFTYRKLW